MQPLEPVAAPGHSRPPEKQQTPWSDDQGVVWAGEDSNLRRRSRRVYSPFPLATRAPTPARHHRVQRTRWMRRNADPSPRGGRGESRLSIDGPADRCCRRYGRKRREAGLGTARLPVGRVAAAATPQPFPNTSPPELARRRDGLKRRRAGNALASCLWLSCLWLSCPGGGAPRGPPVRSA